LGVRRHSVTFVVSPENNANQGLEDENLGKREKGDLENNLEID